MGAPRQAAKTHSTNINACKAGAEIPEYCRLPTPPSSAMPASAAQAVRYVPPTVCRSIRTSQRGHRKGERGPAPGNRVQNKLENVLQQ